MYKCVIFDLDGVIVDTARLHCLAWEKILKQRWGIRHTKEVDEKTKGVGRYACMKLILDEYHIEISPEEAKETADAKNRYYVELLKNELSEKDLLPGIPEVLEWLKGRGIVTGLASSSQNAGLILDKLQLHFDYIANPANIEKGKPAPDIYLDVAANLGMEPCQCIGIEDAVSGVEAVKKAGMFCIGVGEAARLQESDIVAENTEGILPILEKKIDILSDWNRGFIWMFSLEEGKSDSGATVKRYLQDMAGMYETAGTGNPLIYEYYELGAPEDPGDIGFGTTILYAGHINDQFFMTKGHFHLDVNTAEVYLGIKGQGLLQIENEAGDTKLLPVEPGKAAYSPKGYAHRLINTGEETLVAFFAYRADAGHDYKTIYEKGFRELVYRDETGGYLVKNNPRWEESGK